MNAENSSDDRISDDPHSPDSTEDQASAAASIPGLVVLSSDAEVFAVLDKIDQGKWTQHRVDSPSEVLAMLARPGCCAVMLDGDLVPAQQLEELIERLLGLSPRPGMIGIGGAAKAKELMALLVAGRIHRVFPKPISPGGLRLAIDYALARGQTQPASPSAAQRTPQEVKLSARPAASAAPGPWYHRRGAQFGVVAALVLSVILLLSLGGREPSPLAPSDAMPPAAALPESRPEPAASPPPALAAALDDAVGDALGDGQDSEQIVPTAPTIEQSIQPALPAVAEQLDSEASEASEPVLEQAPLLEPDSIAAQIAALSPVEPEPPLEPEPPSELDLLLTEAEARLLGGSVFPAQGLEGNSAFSLLQDAAAINPGDARVIRLRSRLADAMVDALGQSLERGDLAQFEQLMPTAEELAVTPLVLSDLMRQAETVAEALEAERLAAHAASLLDTALERVAAQRLFEPETDSAAFYLAQLRAEVPDHPELAVPLTALQTVLLDEIQALTAAGDLAEAEQWAAWLEPLGVEATVADRLALELTRARRQQAFLSVPATAAEVTILHQEPHVFPSQTRRRLRDGWVDLDFIVDENGLPRDIDVVGSEPERMFDRAAIDAVSRYRFAPFVMDGEVYERRVALRLVFSLP